MVFFLKAATFSGFQNNSKAICGLSRSNFSVSMLEKVILELAMALRSFSCVGLEKGEKIRWIFGGFLGQNNKEVSQ